MRQGTSRRAFLAAVALCALVYGGDSAGQAAGVPEGTLPYVPPAGRVGGLEGFVRVVNHATTPATAEITGYDDTGEAYGPVTLALPASSSVRLLSEHLERGSAVDGLPVGLGDGTGDWRLELRSAEHVGAVALVRTPDRFMTSLQAVVEPESEGGTVYPVATFNPGSNTAKASFLRLVNPGEAAASVTISGIDDRGAAAPGGDVGLTVPAGGAVRVTARELESGEAHLRGRLGDGAGKWRLRVASDRPLFVMNLLRSQTDSGLVYVSNLSAGGSQRDDGIHNATDVVAGQPVTGSISSAADEDFFRLPLDQPGTAAFWATGAADTVITLLDGQGNDLSSASAARVPSEDAAFALAGGPARSGSRVSVTTGLDDVYARVRLAAGGRTGDYTLHNSFTENLAPRVRGTLTNLAVKAGGDAVSLNLSPFFVDPEGGNLTYGVSFPGGSVGPISLGVTISGSVLNVTAPEDMRVGPVSIEIKASDPFGLFAVQLLRVEVQPGTTGTGVDGCADARVRQYGGCRFVYDRDGYQYAITVTNSCPYRIDITYQRNPAYQDSPRWGSSAGFDVPEMGTSSSARGTCILPPLRQRFRICVESCDDRAPDGNCFLCSGDNVQWRVIN